MASHSLSSSLMRWALAPRSPPRQPRLSCYAQVNPDGLENLPCTLAARSAAKGGTHRREQVTPRGGGVPAENVVNLKHGVSATCEKTNASRRTMLREDLGWLVRGVLAGVVFVLAVAAFRLGVSHLALERARGVALLTDNDLLNLKVAFRLAQSHPQLQVIAHCEGCGRAGRFRPLRADHPRVSGARERRRDRARAGRRPAATRGLRKFHSHVQPSERFFTKPLDGDLMDPVTWQAIAGELEESSTAPTVLIASEDESVNLQSALLARRRWPESRVFVRCIDESSFAEELATLHRFTLLPVEELVREALYRSQSRWFGPRRKGADSGRQVGLVPDRVA